MCWVLDGVFGARACAMSVCVCVCALMCVFVFICALLSVRVCVPL